MSYVVCWQNTEGQDKWDVVSTAADVDSITDELRAVGHDPVDDLLVFDRDSNLPWDE